MNAAVLPPAPVPVADQVSPVGSSAAEAWDTICRGMGVERLSPEEAAALPPWTEEGAAAFERTIANAFERVEEPAPPLPA